MKNKELKTYVDFSDLKKVFKKFDKMIDDQKLKIIDWECKGNVVKFYLGKGNLKTWHGDDWDDVPYEHNAGRVYEEFIFRSVVIGFGFDWDLYEPCFNKCNSEFCKDDFKKGYIPILVAKRYNFNDSLISSFEEVVSFPDSIKFYMNDTLEKIYRKIRGNEDIKVFE